MLTRARSIFQRCLTMMLSRRTTTDSNVLFQKWWGLSWPEMVATSWLLGISGCPREVQSHRLRAWWGHLGQPEAEVSRWDRHIAKNIGCSVPASKTSDWNHRRRCPHICHRKQWIWTQTYHTTCRPARFRKSRIRVPSGPQADHSTSLVLVRKWRNCASSVRRGMSIMIQYFSNKPCTMPSATGYRISSGWTWNGMESSWFGQAGEGSHLIVKCTRIGEGCRFGRWRAR